MWLADLIALTRPLTYFDHGIGFGAISPFELNSIITIGLVGILFLFVAQSTHRPATGIDYAIAINGVWGVVNLIALYPDARLPSVLKFVFPPISYFVFARAYTRDVDYLRMLALILIALGPPMLLSAVMTLRGQGLAQDLYWTGLQRYAGIYSNLNEAAHNFGLVIFTAGIWYGVSMARVRAGLQAFRPSAAFSAYLVVLCVLALFNLWMSGVRTVYLGIGIFGAFVLLAYARRWILPSIVAVLLFGVWQSEQLARQFIDLIEVSSGERGFEEAGSSRIAIWSHNLKVFVDLPVENKLLGVGMGNVANNLLKGEGQSGDALAALDAGVWQSHNDFLSSLMETGIVGFVILIVMYALLRQRILGMPADIRFYFLGFFWAVMAMHFVSNRYLNRFGLWQCFFMIMAGAEILRRAPRPVPRAPAQVTAPPLARGSVPFWTQSSRR